VEGLERVVRFLEEEGLPFTWEAVIRAVEELGLGAEEPPDTFARDGIAHEVINEGIRRSVEVAGKFLDLLEVPSSTEASLSGVEMQLRWGRKVELWCFSRKRGSYLEMGVEDLKLGETIAKKTLPLPDSKLLRTIGEIGLVVEPGRATLWNPAYAPDLAVTRGRALFGVRTYEPKDLEELKKASKKAKALAPLLSLMEVEDLREAIEALGELKEGEIRVEGPYVLARGERFLALRRGAIFGDTELDGAFLLERAVNLSFPDEVEVSFRPRWGSRYVNLRELKIRWMDEVFQGEEGFHADPLLRDPITWAIRNGLQRELDRLESSPSYSPRNAPSRMLAFLKAFAKHEDPFRALTEGKLHHYATAELFADF